MKLVSDGQLYRYSLRAGKRLLQRSLTVVTAESCTGGLIAKILTDVPGSSRWFLEGWVVYSNDSKVSRLGVAKRLLLREGAVSAAVVRAMAIGALRLSHADVSIAVTGIAGPGGGVPGKPVGTVWFGWAWRAGRSTHIAVQVRRFRGDRDTVRRKTAVVALRELLKLAT